MRFSPAASRRCKATAVLIAMALALCAVLAVPASVTATPLAALNIVLVYESSTTDSPVLGITGRLPDDTQLPAEIVLPVPEGANVIWSGEYFLRDDVEDVFVPAVLEDRNGIQALVFTLTESRIGHAEMTYPESAVPVGASGGVYDVGYDLVVPVDTGPVVAAVGLPDNLAVVRTSEAVQEPEESGGVTFYSVERENLTAGDSVAFSLRAQEFEPLNIANETIPWMVPAVAAVIIGITVWLVLAARRRRARDARA